MAFSYFDEIRMQKPYIYVAVIFIDIFGPAKLQDTNAC
jgi:hypothetical protein